MNYVVKKVEFEISNFTPISTNIINSHLLIHTAKQYQTFKITNYIGKGTVGQVYMIESNKNIYVIKISNADCTEDLIDEVELLIAHFKKNNISHPSYPLCYGHFKNLKAFGVIYPYFGFYNLEKIKSIDYKIDFAHNIQIIVQLIGQMQSFTNILHCDIKPSNVVINVLDNEIKATIIDFGLIKSINLKDHLISTNYITSPESLLTLSEFSACANGPDGPNDFSIRKHDYFGLFSIIINLFIGKTFWTFFLQYLTDIKFNSEQLYKQSASIIFVYTWFRFTYEFKNQIKNPSLLKLIERIEQLYPNISEKKFLSYDKFFNQYISLYIDTNTIGKSNLPDLQDFTKQLIHFDYAYRPELSDLLAHRFIVKNPS